MSFTARQHEVEAGVRKVLSMDPYIADGPRYNRLCLLYWTHIDKVVSLDKESGYYYTWPERFESATSPEALTRAFRRLVNKEVARLSPETETRRRELQEKHRLYAIGDDPDADTETIIDHRRRKNGVS